jgi:hypothetical protein
MNTTTTSTQYSQVDNSQVNNKQDEAGQNQNKEIKVKKW